MQRHTDPIACWFPDSHGHCDCAIRIARRAVATPTVRANAADVAAAIATTATANARVARLAASGTKGGAERKRLVKLARVMERTARECDDTLTFKPRVEHIERDRDAADHALAERRAAIESRQAA